jgi:hypothetical protein
VEKRRVGQRCKFQNTLQTVYVRAEDNVALPGKISKRCAMHDTINAICQILQLTSIEAESGQAYIAPDGGYSWHVEIRLPKQTGYR